MSDGNSEKDVGFRQPSKAGLVHGLLAYTAWGLIPLYFRALHSVDPFEIVAQRIVWSVVFLSGLMFLLGLYREFRTAICAPRVLGALALSAALIACNWLVYVWAISADHVVAASLGYFLNPLINVLIGLAFLQERLRRGQMFAIIVAAVGVALLAINEIATLWISLTLALSFASYGLVRKLTPVPAPVGLAVETLILSPFALGFLYWLDEQGKMGFGGSVSITLMLVASGAITSVPLILFASAARRVRMVTLGLMQYAAPSLQFLLGVFVFGEHLSSTRWASFALIWCALALFVWDSLRGAKKSLPSRG